MTREAEWDDQERALMLGLALYEAQCCPRGHWLPESGDPDNEDHYAAQANRCHACNAVMAEADRVKDNPHPSALLIGADLRR